MDADRRRADPSSTRHQAAGRCRRAPTLWVLVAAVAVTMAVVLAGCGDSGPAAGSAASTAGASSGGSGGSGPAQARSAARERPPTHARTHERRVAYLERVRDAVVHGAAVDFAIGTGIGGPSFEACVKAGLRERLDGPTVANLVAIYRRPYGTADAAQALNALAAPVAGRCGHRYWVPELVEAAHGLRSAAPSGAAIARLGVTYGPYLGRRCRLPFRRGGCGMVGIDVVFGRPATRVEATAGAQAIRLRTPGQHNGILHHDWVGTFTHAGFARMSHPHRDAVYVALVLRVRFADGRRAHALFPHVPVGGWG